MEQGRLQVLGMEINSVRTYPTSVAMMKGIIMHAAAARRRMLEGAQCAVRGLRVRPGVARLGMQGHTPFKGCS